tara:strand:- start:1823 stop:1960 length:138 start_codon:yes stop_codon:yes gene_type:complete
MVIIIDGVKTEVKFTEEQEKGTFLETLYEWLDLNDIDIEFNKNGG